MNNQTTRIMFLSVLFFCCVSGFVLAEQDKTPPVVDKTEPVNGHLATPNSLSIQVWLLDPSSPKANYSSGVDPQSVILTVNDETIPITTQDIGNSRLWVYSQNNLSLPGNSWITAVVTAKDRAGNIMEPYCFMFRTEAIPDVIPPVISNLSPPDKSNDNICHPVISCWIQDSMSGIDLESIVFTVKGQEAIFTTAMIQGHMEIFHVASKPFEYEEIIVCEIRVSDKQGNLAVKRWDFQIASRPQLPPKQSYPAVDSLLNYQLENGIIRFIWMTDNENDLVRLRIRAEEGIPFEIMDLSSSDFWVSGHLRGFSFYLGYELWRHYSTYDHLQWSIAIINEIGGECLTEYSDWSTFRLAPPDAVVLRNPCDCADFDAFDRSPVFQWDSFNGAKSYLLGIAKYNQSTQSYENKLTLYVESELTSLQLTEEVWRHLGHGTFIWAILAEYENGNYSDFMNYQFSKKAPVIINEPLSFN